MAVYVDDMMLPAVVRSGPFSVRGVWCHMTADTTEELLAMAARIGLRPSWIQYPGTWKEHFDVTVPRRKRALAAGAVEVGVRERVMQMVERRVALTR